MAKKRLDFKTLQLMNLEDSPDAEKLYEFDDPITSVKIFDIENGGQGNAPFYAVFFNGDKVLKNVSMKGNAVSCHLTCCDDGNDEEDICADPRIVATFILGAWLDYPFCLLEGYNKEKELTEALNPVFTRSEALAWLEQCGFIGMYNYNNPFRVEDRSKWFIEDPRKPGYDIYMQEPNIQANDVPDKAKKLYNKYIDLYREKVKKIDSYWKNKRA